MGRGGAVRAVRGGSNAPRRRWTVWRLRERAAEAWGNGSHEPREALSPEPEPSEADLLDELGDRICRMAAHIHAATAHFLELVAEFDRRVGWKAGGHRSCAHWLVVRTGYTLRTARGYVRVARALEELPRIGEAMARGRLSFCQVRALTRVATPETEEDLLVLAEGCTVSTLERRLRAWRRSGREDEAARERALHRSLRLVVVPDDDGGYVVRGRLGPEVGAVFMRALEAAEDALYRKERSAGDGDGSCEPRAADRDAVAAANRRRAAAVGLLAERALAAGFGGDSTGDDADDGGDVPVSGTRAERYLAFVFVDAETLAEDGEPGRSELEDGTRLSAETARRLACDAATVHVNRGAGGEVLDVGRKRRTVPPALRRALEVRDRGCRFPGCGLRFCDAHHIKHWSDGGETSLENTLLLCRFHHRLVHEEGWTVEWWGRTRAVFTDPRGNHHLDERPEPPEVPAEPARALIRENRRRGVDPGPLEAGARWKRERDIPDEVWFAATEAGIAVCEARTTAPAPL